MDKTHIPNISIMRGGPQVLRKKSWRFAIAQLVSIAAIVAGLLVLPSAALAIDRLTDKEVVDLLTKIESDRSTFEAALDVQLKNTVISGPKGEVNTNEFFDDLQDQVTRARERFTARLLGQQRSACSAGVHKPARSLGQITARRLQRLD